jgi:hypothetical protein
LLFILLFVFLMFKKKNRRGWDEPNRNKE